MTAMGARIMTLEEETELLPTYQDGGQVHVPGRVSSQVQRARSPVTTSPYLFQVAHWPAMASPPSFHGQCPSCHKQFANDSNVLRHMNHPRTSCMSWFNFFESMHDLNEQTAPTHQEDPEETDHGGTNCNPESASDSGAGHYEKYHPNVPLIFGSGPGLVDTFNADQHVKKRKENLYYPFSSKAEWGLALWLLRSGLLMRAIDDFLALPIVSPTDSRTDLL